MNEIKALLTAILGELVTANRLKIRELMEHSKTESERDFYLECSKNEDKISEIVANLMKEVFKDDG